MAREDVLPIYNKMYSNIIGTLQNDIALPDYSDDPSDTAIKEVYVSWLETLIDELKEELCGFSY